MMYSNGGYHSFACRRTMRAEWRSTRFSRPGSSRLLMHDTACVPNDMTIEHGIATMHVP